ncbi:hypothetical protein AA313_de0203122 [Arthrobotrys entomopaga]|nr:hypothetical protein AA313_de0203122 [Arthrobotrys entomopaga]
MYGFRSKSQSTKSKPSQSSTLSAAEPTPAHPDNDRPTKKLKTSASTSTTFQDPSTLKTTPNSILGSKNASLSRSPSKKASMQEDPLPTVERKSTNSRTGLSKRDISITRPKSPSNSSKSDQSRNRRSQSPSDRPRDKPTRREDKDHKTKPERQIIKEVDRLPVLPEMLSPLSDELNRLADDYIRRHPEIGKDREYDSISMDDDSSKKTKKTDKLIEKNTSHSDIHGATRIDGDSRSSKTERRAEKFDSGIKDMDSKTHLQGQSPRHGFKIPAKRPPTDIASKSKESEREPARVIARLHYGTRNIGKVKKILKSEVDRTKCPKCMAWREESSVPEYPVERGPTRERSPHPPTRVSLATLKAAPNLKHTLNGKIATPNRRLAPSSDRPRSSEQGSSRLSTTQSNERDPDDLDDNDILREDSEAFLALGIKLKHKADAALGVKNPEEANLNHALIYACHCVIAYFLSFGLDDELRRREKRSSTSESWRSVVGYIEFLLSSRLKANPAIHGLLYQMGAICSERVSSFEQQRLLGISLTEPVQTGETNGRNVLENVRRSRNDLIRILRTNHEWWNLGHQRLPWGAVQADFQKTWAKRATQVVKKPQIIAGHYLTPFYLPLYSGSTAFEAASFAWMVTQEWAGQARLNLDTGLYLTWPKRDET